MDYSTVENLKAIIAESLDKASRLESKWIGDDKIDHLLNNLCTYGNCRYLEIAKGNDAKFLPALWKNEIRSQIIHLEPKNMEALQRYKTEIGRQGIWAGDPLTLPDEVIKRANVFFYDCSEEKKTEIISKFGKRCADPFIFVQGFDAIVVKPGDLK